MHLKKLCCYPLKQRKKDITNTITILKQNKQE